MKKKLLGMNTRSKVADLLTFIMREQIMKVQNKIAGLLILITLRRNAVCRAAWIFVLTILSWLAMGYVMAGWSSGIAVAGLMDYRDVSELEHRLQELADESSHARLFTIGHSIDYKTNPDRPTIYPIYAIRISASTNERIQDDYSKNSILFKAGSHPREWLTTESCLTLAEYLVEHAEDEQSGVPVLLDGVDVWIIPLTNPAGRAIDDTHSGDPRFFSRDPLDGGWRGNGDTLSCDHGVNVARNFSRGWSSVNSTDCTNDPDGTNDDPADGKDSDNPAQYRGFAPFSTLEAVALRNFVQNHGISMAVVVHSNAQQIWNSWGNGDVAGKVISRKARRFWGINLDDPNLALTRTSVGGGMGQFSAWLSATSDTAGQPDRNTVRGIQTIYVELPFRTANYTDAYRFEGDDDVDGGSNGFHPSGDHVRDLIEGSFIPMTQDADHLGRVARLQYPKWEASCR